MLPLKLMSPEHTLEFQRDGTNINQYKRGDEVLQVMLDWLMEYNILKWNQYPYNKWTVGRVALATPHGARSCVEWSMTNNCRPIRWSRVYKVD